VSSRLRTWLERAGLAELYEPCMSNDVDLDVLGELTEADLRELGLTLGQRKRLQRALAESGTAEPHPAAAAARTGVSAAAGGPATAERRRLTVLFVDLVGYTALASRVDAEEIRTIVAGFQTCVAEAVERNGGTVAKYMGDAVLAYFGYPRAEEHAAESAARAGLAALAAVGDLETGTGVRLAARAGAATGLVVVGDLVGAGDSLERQVVGDTPNLAARLQALAEPGTLLVSAATHALIRGIFSCRSLGPVAVKGFDAALEVYAVQGEREVEDRFRAAHDGIDLAPLEGREAEFAALRAEWARARDGAVGAAIIVGEAGMGKSRLLAAFEEHVAAAPHSIVRLACQPQFANTALQPVAALLGRFAGIGREDDAATRWRKLAEMLAAAGMAQDAPLVAAVIGVPNAGLYEAPSETPQRQRVAFVGAFAALLRYRAGNAPLALLVEDLHWADATTREFLAALPDALAGLPAVLVATTRPNVTSALSVRYDVRRITLDPLPADATAALVRHVAGERALPEGLVRRIGALAEGNPLFVEELAKTLLQSDAVRSEEDSRDIGRGVADGAIPATLHDALMARLDNAGPAKDIAQIAAAIGREFDLDLLAAVAPVAPETLRAQLARLEAEGIVFPTGTSDGLESWMFKHVLIQEAAYESLLRSRRRDLHAAIAETIATTRPEEAARQPEVMAHHLGRAGEFARAIELGCAASMNALVRSANAEAVAQARTCLDWVYRMETGRARDEAELRVRALLTPALMQHRGYSVPEVSESAGRAMALLDALGDQPAVFPTLWSLKMFHHVRSERDRSRELAERFLALAERVEDDDQRVAGLPMLGQCLWIEGRLDEAETVLRRGLDLYDRARHRGHAAIYGLDSLSYCRLTLSQVLWITGRGAAALAASEGALADARSVNHVNSIGMAYLYLVMLRQQRGERDEVARLSAEALAYCERTGVSTPTSYIAMIANWARGDIDASTQIHDIHATIGARLGMTYYHGLAVENAIESGDAARARDLLAPALEQARTTGERYWLAHLLRLAARIETLAGGAPRPPLEQAVETARAQGARTLERAALADLVSLGGTAAEQGRLRSLEADGVGTSAQEGVGGTMRVG